jgi:AcrR family transcriptional regulator
MKGDQRGNGETSKRILFAAKREFAEKGFSGARMGAIAKEAEVNQALIHYYFKSKENLYRQVLHRLFRMDQVKMIQEQVAQWELQPPQSLYVAIYLIVQIHLKAIDPDFNRIIAREVAEGRKYLRSLIRDYMIPHLELLEDVIIRGIASGEFATRNSLMAVLELITFVISYESNREMYRGTKWYRRLYGRNSSEDLFQFTLEHTFKALSPSNEVRIPKIAPAIIKSLDKLVDTIKRQQNWNQLSSPGKVLPINFPKA